MDSITDSAIIVARLIVAGIFGLLTFGFGVFFWIMLENHPADHPVFTTVLGMAFALSALAMIAALWSVIARINRVG